MAQVSRTQHLAEQDAFKWTLGLEPSIVIINAAITFAGPKNSSGSEKTSHVMVYVHWVKRLLWPSPDHFLKQVSADFRRIFFAWAWFSPVWSSPCPERPHPGQALLYCLNLLLLLWFSHHHWAALVSMLSLLVPYALWTCQGTFLPLLSSRSMLYYVKIFHLPFNLASSLVFVTTVFQWAWEIICLLTVPLWATVKCILFLKSRNNFSDKNSWSKRLPKSVVAILLSILIVTWTRRNCQGWANSKLPNGAKF